MTMPMTRLRMAYAYALRAIRPTISPPTMIPAAISNTVVHDQPVITPLPSLCCPCR
jgi:hypothetical protein